MEVWIRVKPTTHSEIWSHSSHTKPHAMYCCVSLATMFHLVPTLIITTNLLPNMAGPIFDNALRCPS